MGFRGFGYTVEDHGRPEQLDEQLRLVAESGYDYAEVDPQYWDVLVNGRIVPSALARFAAATERHRGRLRYTMHGPFHANLFDPEDGAAHERLLRSGLEVARAIGAELMVVHPGFRLAPPTGVGWSMHDLRARECAFLQQLADEAAGWGGSIALETWCATGVPGYSYAVWPEQLLQQVEQIGRPNAGICIDFGHIYLSAHWYGFDFVEGVRTVAPKTIHFHVQDLSGVSALDEHDTSTLGRGDMHVPPGWAGIPFDALFGSVDFPLDPIFNVEVWGTRFLPYRDEILKEIKRLAALRAG